MPRAPLYALLLLTASAAGCGSTPRPDSAVDPLDSVTIPQRGDWMDKYATSNTGDMRFFNISALMQTHGLTRLQAVEVQNQYRDLSRANPDEAPEARFNAALAQVKGGMIESGIDEAALAKARFIIVFDLDDTLWDQYFDGRCHDVTFPRADGGKTVHMKLVPGWAAAIERINALGGKVVLFSANRDDPTRENLQHWMLKGTPLLSHPLIAGVMTNSYLILQSKHEGRGAKNPRKGRPIIDPAKDMRIVDESLSKVIIVDDNPTRLFQLRNARLFKKFHGDHYCSKDDPMMNQAWDAALPTVIAEIEDTVAWMDATPGRTFVEGYLPYSLIGQVAVDALVRGAQMTPADAVTHVRAHPELVDRKF